MMMKKYWRAEDFVANASMDELTGNWLTLDENVAGDTWADCVGAGGELDRQAADELTERALDSLLAHGVVDGTRGREGNSRLSRRDGTNVGG